MARRLVNTPSSALASVQTKWQTYTDERFGFKLDYPEGWYMLARDDTPGRVGAVLSFSNVPELRSTNESYGDDRIVVSVGFYLMEIDKGESLSKWIDLYEEKSRVFEVPEITILEQKVLPISKRQGLLKRGISPLGSFQIANIKDDRVVWFIWSNADAKSLDAFSHMVASFALGDKSPKSLQSAYGPEFQPTTLNSHTLASPPQEVVRSRGRALESLTILSAAQDPAGWRLPFSGQRTITTGPGCRSTHQGSASGEAIDYSMPAGTSVKATYGGVVSFFGWNNQGYGNLVNIDSGPSPTKRQYYAHLQSFGVNYVGEAVATGTTIGFADSTGNSTGNHLHFEARVVSTNTRVAVRTLPTTTWRSGDPNDPCWGTVDDWDGTATGP
ncbi:MAG: hypothetical protein CVU38_13605 [Chloroflexi bacterium HGW-Chloroflexi-1]|nr:MAG: hypothetical protein CVU38_13605 [Chloroflexi bacterium HGW-Chloroflexi-1]